MTNRTPPYPFENWKYRWITPPEQDAPDWEAEMRDAASMIFQEFIGSGVKSTKVRSQRQVDVFQFITEGRAHGNPRYSECVDFAGGMLCFLGVRGEGLINRDDDDLDGKKDTVSADTDAPWWNIRGSRLWRMGMNVALLYQGSISLGAFRKPGVSMPERGDPFFVDLNTGLDHVGVFLTDPVKTGESTWSVKTGEGGQFDGVGQCCLEYDAVIERLGENSWMLTRNGKKPRVFSGFIDLTSLKMDAPAIVPPSFEGGFEVED